MANRMATEAAQVAAKLDEMQERMERMERFMAQRFDEISVEINAASELVGMSENGVKESFGEVLELLSAISAHGSAQSRVQAGVELDAVVKITEDAANRILDAADRIGGRLDEPELWNDGVQRADAIAGTMDDVQEILMACAFQDITGQRIERTLKNLQLIEARLTSTLSKFGINPADYQEGAQARLAPGTSQNEIDGLFDGSSDGFGSDGAEAGGDADQDSIDAMFDK